MRNTVVHPNNTQHNSSNAEELGESNANMEMKEPSVQDIALRSPHINVIASTRPITVEHAAAGINNAVNIITNSNDLENRQRGVSSAETIWESNTNTEHEGIKLRSPDPSQPNTEITNEYAVIKDEYAAGVVCETLRSKKDPENSLDSITGSTNTNKLEHAAGIGLDKESLRSSNEDFPSNTSEVGAGSMWSAPYPMYVTDSVNLNRLLVNKPNINNKLDIRTIDSSFENTTQNNNVDNQKIIANPKIENPDSSTMNKKVINISSYELKKEEIEVLNKGLNFALAPNKIPNEEIVCNLEDEIKTLKDEDKDLVRQECAVILRKAKPPRRNLNLEQLKALKGLGNNKDIVILKADKGGATVIMNYEDYVNKMKDHLYNSGSYKKLEKNLISKITNLVKKAIKETNLDDKLKKRLTTNSEITPRIYRAPKIHKKKVPLRPIVNTIRSPTYELAKYVASILSPLVGKTSSYIKDSNQFVKYIKNTKLDPGDKIVSFDVV